YDIPGRTMDVETRHRIAQSRLDALKAQIPPVLQTALKYRRTVWVVGEIDDGELMRWRNLIANVISVRTEQVRTLRFSKRLQDLDPNRPMPTAAEQVDQ